MSITIALAGNPNSGKTTLFNSLTGSSQYVGNWPGVTVEKKEGKLKGRKDVNIMDLPGIYSLSPYTLEEVVSRNYLINEKPDAIINIIDGTNLERNLYLTTQILEIGIPTVIAINMMDVVKKRGHKINIEELSKELGCKVFEISALKNIGIEDLKNESIALAQIGGNFSSNHRFQEKIENEIDKICELIPEWTDNSLRRWYALKVFEKDEKILEKIKLTDQMERIINEVENSMDDDTESIITDERYNYIGSVIDNCLKRGSENSLDTSDKIDKIVTNRILGLPIFAGIMWVVYYISVTTVGAIVTDWTNDFLFGTVVGPGVANILEGLNTAQWLEGLVVDGIIGGVGAVLGFVPQLLVMFILLGILEECGYMSRIAFLLDRVFRKFGLSGKSFIPILIGTGCGIPGVMASRTIENENDRRMTIMTTTFIPCGAKLPIIALIAGALFSGASWVAPSAYFLGIAAIIFSGIVLKKTRFFAGDTSPFVMELPDYHIPTIGTVFRSMWERGSSFIKKAGTIILLSTIFIWFTSNFGVSEGSIVMVDNMDNSILATIGSAIAFVFKPLGFGNWKAAVATITGLIAKENVVGTFGVLYKVAEGSVGDVGEGVWANLQADYTVAAGFAFLVFNLLCAPCFAAIGAIKREMNSTKWLWATLAWQTGLAYITSLIVYQLVSFAMNGIFGVGTITAFIMLAGMIYLLVRPNKYKGMTTNEINLLRKFGNKEKAFS